MPDILTGEFLYYLELIFNFSYLVIETMSSGLVVRDLFFQFWGLSGLKGRVTYFSYDQNFLA